MAPWAWPASDIGIALQTWTIAVLLHRRRMVSLASLDYAEMGRCLGAGLAGAGAVWLAFHWLSGTTARLAAAHMNNQLRWLDFGEAAVGAVLWAVVAWKILELSGSALPKVTMKRLRLI